MPTIATPAASPPSLKEVEDPRPFGVARLEGSRITEFVEKPATVEAAPSRFVNAGTYLFEPEVLDHIPAGRVVSLERETIHALLAGGHALHGMPFDGFWVDCGRPESYLDATASILAAAGVPLLLGAGAAADGTLASWNVLGDACVVDAGAHVEESVLLTQARVAEGARLRRCIVGEDAIVGEGAVLEDVCLGDGVVVEAGSRLAGVRVPAE